MKAKCAPIVYEAWQNKYGATYLMYLGVLPVIMTWDTEIIKNVLGCTCTNHTQANVNMLKFLLK